VDDQTDKLTRELVDQKAETKAITDELSFQGRTLSVFTVVTSFFLPLNFFAQVGTPIPRPPHLILMKFLPQYFQSSNISDKKDKSAWRRGWVNGSLPRFWAIAAPLTALIVGLAGFYIMKSRYDFRQLGRFLCDCNLE
jgi:hypothetical protein